MILLDTNVVSELFRLTPDMKVIEWLDAQPLQTLYLSAITVAEMRWGVAQLPAGKRRDALNAKLEEGLMPLVATRVLPFDSDCAQSYADLMTKDRAEGRGIALADGLIAAVAAAKGLAVATRDTSPFEAAGLTVFNPWD
ncbi:PIN domain-containing protein [Caballeronia sp. NK8]|uniref:type II toxin-antitoxin system VapC family toxin n=1 Tax=Caballeronia sp. NK8 TaxID=140098 RepID=UPI001BB4AC94|nr:type II toxin-antitoxin system VapC family toxin [Caballeronia sp. NK8]BCQ22848.1 PIN domain-containing protein [Caballeronia sp. NK8]